MEIDINNILQNLGAQVQELSIKLAVVTAERDKLIQDQLSAPQPEPEKKEEGKKDVK